MKGYAYQREAKGEWLYASTRDQSAVESSPVELTAIPFYANANRGLVEMVTWLREMT